MQRTPSSILFLCVGNSARSQMAEGLARRILAPAFRIQSAGSRPAGLNPAAVMVMREVGIDISGQRSKSINEIDVSSVDAVVTLCAEEVCPVFPGEVQRLHWPLGDPATARGSDEERLEAFRRVRDKIRRLLEDLRRSIEPSL